ncbi:MAG: hypothetical protein K0S29_329, partial [Gammaproteobacteria bacterium]|nr:hypothetical protein [Gammaproteobacteria bacterium]
MYAFTAFSNAVSSALSWITGNPTTAETVLPFNNNASPNPASDFGKKVLKCLVAGAAVLTISEQIRPKADNSPYAGPFTEDFTAHDFQTLAPANFSYQPSLRGYVADKTAALESFPQAKPEQAIEYKAENKARRLAYAVDQPLPTVTTYVGNNYTQEIPLVTFNTTLVDIINVTLADGSPLPSWFNFTKYPAKYYGNSTAFKLHLQTGSINSLALQDDRIYAGYDASPYAVVDVFYSNPHTGTYITYLVNTWTNFITGRFKILGIYSYYSMSSSASPYYRVNTVNQVTAQTGTFSPGSNKGLLNVLPSLDSQYMAVWDPNTLFLVNTTTFTNPIKTATVNITGLGTYKAMDLQNDVLAAIYQAPNSSVWLNLYAINRTSFSFSSISTSSAGLPTSLKLSQNYLYIGQSTGVQIVNITNPASPQIVGYYSSGQVNNIDVQVAPDVVNRTTAYLNVNNQQIHVVDVSDPATPKAMASYPVSFSGSTAMSSTPGFLVDSSQTIYYGGSNVLRTISAEGGSLASHGYLKFSPPPMSYGNYSIKLVGRTTDGSNVNITTYYNFTVADLKPEVLNEPNPYAFNVFDTVEVPLNLTTDSFDPDAGDSLSYQLLPATGPQDLALVPANGTAGSASHILTGFIGRGQQGTYNASIQITDSQGLSALYRVPLKVLNRDLFFNSTAFNLLPSSLIWNSNQSYSYKLPDKLILDDDLDSINITAGVLSYMNWNGSSQSLTGTVPLRSQGSTSLNFTASDGHGGVLNFSIPFRNPNEAPVIRQNLSDFTELRNLQLYAGPIPKINLPSTDSFVQDANGDILTAELFVSEPSKLALTLNTTANPWTIGGQVLA